MTTYTYMGVSLTYDGNDGDTVIAVGSTTLRIVAADSDDSLSYTITEANPGGFPKVEITNQNFYSVQIDGVSVFNGFDTEIGQLGWGSGNLTYLMNFWDNTNTAYGFTLGGSALPSISSAADWQAFESTITSVGPASDNQFEPGSTISLNDRPGVVITENDSIIGDNVANVFSSGLGNDTISGLGGKDTLNGGSGSDLLNGGAGDDSILAGDGNNLVFAGDGNDYLSAFGGADEVYGGTGSDTLFAGGGDDVVGGATGPDQIGGGAGNDELWGGKCRVIISTLDVRTRFGV